MPVGDYADISDLPPALRPGYRPPADVLGDMARGAAPARPVPAEPAPEHRGGPALVAQCRPCVLIRHSLCELKLGTGPCLCMTCHTRDITARAERALSSSDVRALRSAVQELLILHAQRAKRQEARDSREPRPNGICRCGCGREVAYPRKYATKRCVKAAAMRRYRKRVREGSTGAVPKAFRETVTPAVRRRVSTPETPGG